MKLSTAETYDISQISDTQAYSDLSTFIDYSVDLYRDLITSYQNDLTLQDNLKTTILSLTLQHGVPYVLGQYDAFTLSSINSRTPVRSYRFTRDASNSLVLTVYFDQAIQVFSNQAVWFKGQTIRYRCRDVSNLLLGDFVTFSGFGSQFNNGTFQVVSIDQTNGYIYCNNYLRDSDIEDESKTGYVGQANLKVICSVALLV